MRRRHAAPQGPAFAPHFGSDREALIRTLIAEAGGEGQRGMESVGFNLRNRADANYHGYGNSIAQQALARRPGSKYGEYSSWNPYGGPSQAGKNALKVSENSPVYRNAAAAADTVMGRMAPDPTQGASNYRNSAFSSKKSDSWFNKLENKIDIGHHTFGREPGFKLPDTTGGAQLGDKSMLAGDMSNAVAPNARYAAMASIAPRAETPERQMARTAAPERNRMMAMNNAMRPPQQEAQQPISSGNFLASRYGQDPNPPSAQPAMADTPVLQEPQQAGGPAAEGMAMNALPTNGMPMMAQPAMQPMLQPEMMGMPGGLPDMMAQATIAPQMGDMGGGMDFGGGFDLGGLFG